jgi:ankyrin repeat protein
MSHKKRDAAQLLSALKMRDTSQAMQLLSRCSSESVNVADESGRTPLHLAVTLESDAAVKIIEALVSRGACTDVPNAHGTTPLQKAVMGNHTEAALALTRMGADITITNARGSTAIDLARSEDFRIGAIEQRIWRASNAHQ